MLLSKRRSSNSAISPVGDSLAPLSEGPSPDAGHNSHKDNKSMMHWLKEQLERRYKLPHRLLQNRRSDPKVLLGVMGYPLAPFTVSADSVLTCGLFSLKATKGAPIEASCAQYIIHQYIAASGGLKCLRSIKNSYTRGKVRMLTSEFETATRSTKNPIKAAENGWFVLWQMMPDKWHVELEIEGTVVQAGSDGNMVWRYTPWLGPHAANGPVRPLRRAIQGLDPLTTANLFVGARCVGEKKIGDEDCFILKLSADSTNPSLRSEGPAETIRHVLNGYFSQRTGLLVFMEDTHLTRIQANGAEAIYWETTVESTIEDYRVVDGVTVAHGGHSVVTLYRFGEEPMSHTKTRMEEIWTIEDLALNVEGVSTDCFLPPSEVGKCMPGKGQ